MAYPQKPEEKRNFRQDVTQKIVDLIEKGNAPWQKPWNPTNAAHALEMPHNAASNKPYRGANVLHLMIKAQDLGSDDPRWMTFKQAQDKGYQIKKGSKGTTVEYWKFDEQIEVPNPTTGEKEKKTVKLDAPHAFYSTVFHASQIKGIPPYEPKLRDKNWDPIEEAENILVGSKAKIFHDQSDSAYYSPSRDDIHLPKAAFDIPLNYYETALHELAHWTGHPERFNRDFSGGFGSEAYAREELRAEMASLYLSIETGVPFNPGKHGDIDMGNYAAYQASWVKKLKSDPHEIFRAAKDAEKIADYLIGLAQERDISKVRSQTPTITVEPKIAADIAAHGTSEVYLNGIKTALTEQALIANGISTDDAKLAIDFINRAKERDYQAPITWARQSDNSYEVSSAGDKRFSALNAKLKDGRSIEEAYQLDIKGYRSQGNEWQLGKGKPPITIISKEDLYQSYRSLWVQWAKENPQLINELREKSAGKVLTDKFASTEISQARALSDILNNSIQENPYINLKKEPHEMTSVEFARQATAIKLDNHGRKWEIFLGSESLAYADSATANEAIKEVHKLTVNNALCDYSGDGPTWESYQKKSFPPKEVIDEYPDLKEKFSTIFKASKYEITTEHKDGLTPTQLPKLSRDMTEKGKYEHNLEIYSQSLAKVNALLQLAPDTEKVDLNDQRTTLEEDIAFVKNKIAKLDKQELTPAQTLISIYSDERRTFVYENDAAIESNINELRKLDVQFAAARLKEDYTPKQIKQTIEICSSMSDPDWKERNKYVNSILEEAQTLLRSPIKEVWIYRDDGPIGDLERREITTNSLAEASKFLREQAKTAPNFGYDKCDFKVTWANENYYEGRYDLQNIDHFRSKHLEVQMQEELGFRAGTFRPAHYKDAMWAKHLSEIELDPVKVEERKKWMRSCEGLDVKEVQLENATSLREAAKNYVPISHANENLSVKESYERHITHFMEQYPGIANVVTFSKRREMKALSESIAKTMLQDGHEPMAVIRCLGKDNPFLDEQSDSYQAVRIGYQSIGGKDFADLIQKTIEKEYCPDFVPADQTREAYFSRDDPGTYDYQRQVGLLHEKYRCVDIPVYVSREIDIKIANNMFAEGFNKNEIVDGLSKGSYERNSEATAKGIVIGIQAEKLYNQGKSDVEVAKILMKDEGYIKKEVTNYLAQSSKAPEQSDEARKFATNIVRKAEREIKKETPVKTKVIER